MSNLEERIYRDAATTAAEVTDADIRPLSLAAGRRWSGRPAERRKSVRVKRVLAPVAAAVSVAVLAGILVAVESGPAHHTGVSPAPPAQHTRDSKAARVAKALGTEALDWYFPASGATYTAGLGFAWLKAKVTADDIDPCLAAAGFPQPAFRGSEKLYKLSFPSLDFPDLAQLAASPGQHYFTSQYLVLHHSTPARQKAMSRAQSRCTAKFAGAVTRVDAAANTLNTAWLNAISRVEHSKAVAATQPPFARCLEHHGAPASLAAQTDPNNPLFNGYSAWADATIQTATSKKQLAADQRHEARVFLACARPTVTVLERVQLHLRGQFFHTHAAAIKRIVRLAAKLAPPSQH